MLFFFLVEVHEEEINRTVHCCYRVYEVVVQYSVRVSGRGRRARCSKEIKRVEVLKRSSVARSVLMKYRDKELKF